MGKLEGNGIMESSRMIMPEHRQAFIDRQREKTKRNKPVIDEQEMQMIERALVDSYNHRKRVELVLFDPFENRNVSGLVTAINTHKREMKLVTAEEEWEWISIRKIISANI